MKALATKLLGFGALLLLAPLYVSAQGIAGAAVTQDGNGLTATVQLPGGISADLTLTFEKVVGLDVNSLGLSAQLLDPADTTILSRLPALNLDSIPAAFPVLIRIQPTASSGLSFSGAYSITLHTANLSFTANTPLRLFKASDTGPFRDVTQSVGIGSYRARGTGGSFSEFLIITDLRAVDDVIKTKFDRIQTNLNNDAPLITSSVYTDLSNRLTAARSAYNSGNLADAITQMQGFIGVVIQNSGANIPDVWSASGSLTNVAGLLRADAGSLIFSLNVKSN